MEMKKSKPCNPGKSVSPRGMGYSVQPCTSCLRFSRSTAVSTSVNPGLRPRGAVEQETGEDPSYFTAAFKHGSSHGGCNVNGPKVAKFLDG